MQGVAHDASKEDCLYLNIYAPKTAPKAKKGFPTMVYFPAGQYTWGSSNDFENNGAPSFASANDVIMVTMGYRLGIFGFLALDELRSRNKDNSTGNYGIQDMRAVLSWLKNNIAAFGGDPDNVVLWGESAGASAVTAHLVAPKSFGLYSKAIMESGAFNTWAYRKWQHANLNSKVVTSHLNCTSGGPLGKIDVTCLENMDPMSLLKVSDDGFASRGKALAPYANALDKCMWAPTVDGVEFTIPPQDALARGAPYVVTGVDFIMGSNRDEGSTFALAQHGFGDDVPWGNTSGLPGIPPDSPSNKDPLWNHPYNYLSTELNESQFDTWANNLWGDKISLKELKALYPPTHNTPDRNPDPAMDSAAVAAPATNTAPTPAVTTASVGGPLPGGKSTEATLLACNATDKAQIFMFDPTDTTGSDISSDWIGQGLDAKNHCFSRAPNDYGQLSASFIDCLPNVTSQKWIYKPLNLTARALLTTQLAGKKTSSASTAHAEGLVAALADNEFGQLVDADNQSLCLFYENKTKRIHGHSYHLEGVGITNCKPMSDENQSNVWAFTPEQKQSPLSKKLVRGSLKVALFVYDPSTKKTSEKDVCLSVNPPPIKPNSVWWWAASRSIGDFLLSCPTRRAARLKQVDHSQNTFMYYFNHTPYYSANQKQTPRYGAFHGAEVPFVWGDAFELVGKGEAALSERMVNYWTNFAWSGNPNYRLDEHGARQSVQEVEWPAYTCRDPAQKCADENIIFDVEEDGHKTATMNHLKDTICDFWDRVAANHTI
jgi:carboxylesterase type B